MREILVVALYDYESTEESGLSFIQGDVIQVLQRLPSGWWDGMLNNKRGWFPSNYVTQPELKIEDSVPEPDEQELASGLPGNWGIKPTTSGKSFKIKSSPSFDEPIDGEISTSNIVFTWGGLSVFIISKIKVLIKDVHEDKKESYIQDTSTVVEAIRIMLHASNMADPNSWIYSDYPQLKQLQAVIINWNGRLILSAKLAATVWPPPEAQDQLLQACQELIGAVRQFATECGSLNIKIVHPPAEELLQYQKDFGNQNTNIVAKLEELVISLVDMLGYFEIRYVKDLNQLTTRLSGSALDTSIQNIIKTVTTFMSIVDEIPLDSLFEDLTVDFKVNRLTLLNCVTDLSSKAKSASVDQILISVELVNKAVKDLLISTKFLIEEKENMENSTLQNYIDQHSAPAPKAASRGLRHAASLTFNEANHNRNSIQPLSPVPYSAADSTNSIPYSGSSDKRPSIAIDSPVGSPGVDFQNIALSIRNSRLSSDQGRYSVEGRRVSNISAASKVSSNAWYLAQDYQTQDIVINNDGLVVSGTIKALVDRLTTHEGVVDLRYLTTFMMTYRSFTNNQELFGLLFERFNIQMPTGLTADEEIVWIERKQKVVRQRVYGVLKMWVESYAIDVEEDRFALNQVAEFTEKTMKSAMTVSSTALLRLIDKKRTSGFQPFQPPSALRDKFPDPILPKNLKKFKLSEVDPLEVARQITMMEFKIFKEINIAELLAKSWGLRAPVSKNIDLLIGFSNHITEWVTWTILNVSDVKKRARMVGFFLAVADRCASLNNYSGLMAILAAFNSEKLARQSRTWKELSSKYHEVLKALRHLMSSDSNFSIYKSTLYRSTPPCIPFIGIYLQDLTLLNETVLTKSHVSSHINFNKMNKTYDILHLQLKFNVPYYLKVVAEIEVFLHDQIMTNRSEREMENLSLMHEGLHNDDLVEQQRYLLANAADYEVIRGDQKKATPVLRGINFRGYKTSRRIKNLMSIDQFFSRSSISQGNILVLVIGFVITFLFISLVITAFASLLKARQERAKRMEWTRYDPLTKKVVDDSFGPSIKKSVYNL
ncbi:hypothetical protein HDV06_002489 [Boothiomyces sp. JEL0866]|nr:hypothetical protein HDV06_002489 [Boothiomyces sp. JEL0866]